MVRLVPSHRRETHHQTDVGEVEKEAVRRYWDAAPCGARDAAQVGASALADIERTRYEREPFIERFARFQSTRDVDVLEVGVGAGTDHLRFARAGAICTGIDLSAVSVEMTRRRLQDEGLSSDLRVGDAESLPFADDSFDVVYSWGVLHHTPDTARAVRELVRVLRPGGRFCAMLYNRRSLVAVQLWLVRAVKDRRPARRLSDLLARHMESPGTKAYTVQELRVLFGAVAKLDVETVVTPYDLRIGRRRFLPRWTHAAVPRKFGWFHVVTGVK